MRAFKKLLALLLNFILLISIIPLKTFASVSLENTPIDVVYKYIDLRDKTLVRDGIPQTIKDYDNEELRYSLRSVLQNIPWVRKIFIIMPNDKVSFLKPPAEINDKIVYIKDKDLLGFDSASSITFEHNALWKLNRFGVSTNFIYMNDDYFIGKPLKKSDFFYVNAYNKVVPYVFYNPNSLYNNMFDTLDRRHNRLERRIFTNKSRQSLSEYRYQTALALKLLYKVLGRKDILIPVDCFSTIHNATPLNINDLIELHSVVENNYEYAHECFNAKFRSNKQITFEPLYSFYFLNKYNRKAKDPDNYTINSKRIAKFDPNHNLFCINTGHLPCSNNIVARVKLVMNNLFPKKTCYEIDEIKDGIYTIESAINPNKALTIKNASRRDFARLQLHNKNNSYAQKFKVTYNNEGYYTLTPLCSNKKINVTGTRNSLTSGIVQYKEHNYDNCKWYIISNGDGYFNIVSKYNGLFMTTQNEEDSVTDYVKCQEGDLSINQKFKFVA